MCHVCSGCLDPRERGDLVAESFVDDPRWQFASYTATGEGVDMSMHGNPGARMGMRSMQRDRKLLEHRIKKGTLPRMLTFAKVYKAALIIFITAVILDAVVSSVAPLLLRAIIDVGIAKHREHLVIGLALLTALLAVIDAVLSLFERRISAVIGESLIYDLRAKVFEHIQAMPIAFFSRTQTGALISRLNNDVIGAQQAFTDLFSNVVGNLVLVAIILGTMLVLSWQITLVALFLLPVFLIPARRVGRRLGTLFQRGMELNAEMNMVMTERFNVAGAMVVKLFGRPRGRARLLRRSSGSSSRYRHTSSDVPALLLHRALVDRITRDRLRLRVWRRGGVARRFGRRNGRCPYCLSHSSLWALDPAVQSQH